MKYKLSDYCKECIKIYDNNDCCLQYEKAMKNKYFMFECLKFEKIAIYSWLLDIKFSYNVRIVEKISWKFILLLRKGYNVLWKDWYIE